MPISSQRSNAMADATTDYLGFFEETSKKAQVEKPSALEWSSARRIIAAWFRDPWQFSKKKMNRTCPICDFKGVFISVGWPSRWEARCPKCASRERHRLMSLWMKASGHDLLVDKRILHFAPEKAFKRMLRHHPHYETADLGQRGVTHQIDVNIPDSVGAFDVVIAHHLLEHIDDDRKAISEFFRVLKPGGFAILSVPLNGTRQTTYENPCVVERNDRLLHYGGHDHKRMYGLDFSDKLEEAGFVVETFRATPEAEVAFSLLFNEWIYIAGKPKQSKPHNA